MLIIAPVYIVGIVCVVNAPDIIDVLARFVVLAIGIAGIVLAIYLLLRLMFANPALKDKNYGILESLRESLKLTKGKMGFVIATALYSIIASIIFQIPLCIVIVLNKTGYFHESFLFSILSLAATVLYFIAFPYFAIIQYLPYNMLNDVLNRKSNVESQENKSNDFVVS